MLSPSCRPSRISSGECSQGAGPSGSGYYHLSTKEAYAVLENRIAKKVSQKECQTTCCQASALASICLCPLIWFTCVKSGKAEVEELKQLQAAAKAKSEAATPGAPLPAELQHLNDDKKRAGGGDAAGGAGCGEPDPFHR